MSRNDPTGGVRGSIPKLIYEMYSPFNKQNVKNDLSADIDLNNLNLTLAWGLTKDGEESKSVTVLGQQALNDPKGPNIYEQRLSDPKLYIARVFSPFNISRNQEGSISSKYDFMVAISGPSFMNDAQQEILRD